MIQVIAIDDEPLALKVLEEHCSKVNFLHLQKTFTNPIEGMEYLNREGTPAIFLDIKMHDIAGVELTELLPPDTHIIFTTAYPDYEVKGFEVNAVDYLLKPISFNRFLKACHKLKSRFNANQTEQVLLIKDESEIARVKTSEIYYIEACGDYLNLYTSKGILLHRQTLKEFVSLIIARKLQIEKENANVLLQLQNLRSQIEPHFIFNTLNSVYALSIEEKAQKTSASIEELSGLFRYALKDSATDKIPIHEELDFLEKYIHLNKIRIQENKDIKVNADILWDKKRAQIAPMLIITFIENAFKYGISFKRPSFIDINISIEDCKLFLVVRNSMHEERTGNTNGLGLINTRKRLELLYNKNYYLKEKQDETHVVVLNLNLI